MNMKCRWWGSGWQWCKRASRWHSLHSRTSWNC